MLHPRALSVASWLAALMIWAAASATAQLQNSTNISTPSDYSIVQRGPHSRIWQRNVLKTNNLSGVVTTNTQSYTELATGLCYMLPNGQYVDSVEQIVAVPGGAQATQGRYQVQWAANANSSGGSVTLSTPDGKQMQSGVSMLTYFDQATSSNVMLAQLQDSTGTIVGANQLIYSNAFNNVTADIAYTYRKYGMTQDIIVRQNLPAPSTYGLNNASTYLGVMTQFYNSPTPAVTAVTNNGVTDDRLLNFGDMRMGPGNAFLTQSNAQASPNLHVLKTWTNIDNQTFLIEEVPYTAVSNSLSTLQSSAIKPDKSKVRRTVLLDRPLRNADEAKSTPKRMVKVEKSSGRETALMVDYVLASSADNFTFQGGDTYYVSDYVEIDREAIIEGGTVIKYTNTVEAQIDDSSGDGGVGFVFATAPFRPAIFTSAFDDTVGTPINGSTGTPSTNGLANYLSTGYDTLIQNARFSYAGTAIWSLADTVNCWNCQFLNCQTNAYSGTYAYNYIFKNVLASHCGTMVWGRGVPVYLDCENITVDSCGTFIDGTGSGSGGITNSILTGVGGSLSSFSLFDCSVYPTNTGLFQTVGAASYYLTNGSTNRGTGTTNIDTNLLADLAMKTTYPPNTNFMGLLATNCTFSPQVPRDNSGTAVDRGYHYDPIDYAVAIEVSNATVNVLPGTVIATCPTGDATAGIWLQDYSVFNAIGTVTNPIYIVDYNTVQEQSNTNWETSGTTLCEAASPDGIVPLSGGFVFTEWSALAGGWLVAAGDEGDAQMSFENCQFYNGEVSEIFDMLFCTNCLFQRGNLELTGGSVSVFCNNLFWQGSVAISVQIDPNTWTFRDNFFDQTTLTTYDNPVGICSNNAYVTTNFGLLPSSPGDVILSSEPVWETGSLGVYYYPTNCPLIHAGSRSAAAAGLYHYTVMTNNLIEGFDTVSIGFHYVGTDSNGVPLNTTGLPNSDYITDTNGNGYFPGGYLPDWPSPFAIYDAGTSLYGWIPTNVRLSYWRFNTTNYTNEAGLAPQQNTLVTNVPDWSGQALVVNDTGSWLEYPITDSNGPIISPGNGTVRLWYMPYSNSDNFAGLASVFVACSNLWSFGLGGNGLIMGVVVTNDGFNSSFFTQGPPFLQFQSNHWYQLTMTYTPTNFAIYTNAVVFVTGNIPPTYFSVPDYEAGNGVFSAPSTSSLGRLSIGNNDFAGAGAPAQGLIDEVETFNYALSPQAIAAGFPTFAAIPTNNVISDSNYVGVSDMLQEYVYGTSNVQTRLGYWRFDNPFLYSEQGQLPLAVSNISLVPSWSGTALNVGSSSSSGITYADVGTNGWANINCQQGCIRFWFKPNWTSPPISSAPFVYIGNANPAISQWSLNVNPAGTISFSTTSNGTSPSYFPPTAASFSPTNWMQIVFNYGPNGVALFTNGILAATNGTAVTNWPPLSDRTNGMVIGNNTAYNSSINGQFDEIETFNYPLDSNTIWTNFNMVYSVDTNLDGIPDLLEDIALPTNIPFLGHPVVITGTIEAEQFDIGGPGVGYYTSATNAASSYRPTKMLISPCDDLGGGYCLDQTVSNDWTQYTINVLVPQTYMVETRVAGIGTNGAFAISFATNGTTYTNTGPISITSTNWTNLSTVVSLNAGTNVMTLLMLTNANTNGIFGSNVGRFNYISIYPWWTNTGPGPTVHDISTGSFGALSAGTNYSDGIINANTIQNAISSLPSAGGTVLIPSGTYYLAQASPNETNDAYLNAAAYILANNIEIAGAGKTNTTLIAYNRATTIFSVGQSPASLPSCNNFTLCDMTIEGRPHWAVAGTMGTSIVPDTNYFAQGGANDINPSVTNGSTTGASIVFYGPFAPTYNMLVRDCRLLYGNDSIQIYQTAVNNVLVTNCDFIMYDNVNSNFGNVGFWGVGYNFVAIGNTFNGNTTLTQTTNQPVGYAPGSIAGNGFVLFQQLGNFFVARNLITNYALEAVQFEGGPQSVVGNTFYTLVDSGYSCALDYFAEANNVFNNATLAAYSTCFVGNSVYGGVSGEEAPAPSGTNPPAYYPYSVNFSGNTVTLIPPLADNNYNVGSMCQTWLCGTASVCGNTLISGGMGFTYGGTTNFNALILNNDISGATYGSIRGNALNTAQIYGNILSEGSTFHAQVPYTNSFGWFFRSNTYLNAYSNSVPIFYDPLQSTAHFN